MSPQNRRTHRCLLSLSLSHVRDSPHHNTRVAKKTTLLSSLIINRSPPYPNWIELNSISVSEVQGSDERSSTLANMLGFSTADGFINVKEGVDEMIKYITNEPSVGLYFVQRHARSSMPYLLNVRDKVVEKVHEVTLHTEDIEDSIYVVRSMTECGLPIADEMIKDINKLLHIMLASQPKKGLITPAASNFSPIGSQVDGGIGRGYLSAVLNSTKQKAVGLRWPMGEQLMSSTTPLPTVVDGGSLSTTADTEAEELPLSSSLFKESDLATAVDEDLKDHDVCVNLVRKL